MADSSNPSGTTRIHLHLQGAALLAIGVTAYALLGLRWWLFAVLILAPDLSMLGYLMNPRVGAIIYNVGHSLLWPAALIIAGLLAGSSGLLTVGIIWVCHIGMDHLFGYGYKYPDRFRHTHFDEV
jgi:hypothetical protein